MAKYTVRLYYSTYCDVEVEAENREDAVDTAYGEVGSSEYTNKLLENLQQNGDEDVSLISE